VDELVDRRRILVHEVMAAHLGLRERFQRRGEALAREVDDEELRAAILARRRIGPIQRRAARARGEEHREQRKNEWLHRFVSRARRAAARWPWLSRTRSAVSGGSASRIASTIRGCKRLARPVSASSRAPKREV